MKIVAVGSKEMCLGMKLSGIKEVYYREEIKNMDELIERLMGREEVGIIILDDGAYLSLSWMLRRRLDTIAKPSIITVPNYGSKAVESESLSMLVKRALGFELR
ncbi:MAG: V-type ATP synthase subunit F [Candidatus Micrarchaeia archaeon]